ncbi:MAG TPA: carbohydrate binding family 9 domain-containing protein, partial [Gemmatimonadaceae bacterium]|nr:carbohydrate binding family 9 domain-containing protein [Gemmatimonadaceae bacterium]
MLLLLALSPFGVATGQGPPTDALAAGRGKAYGHTVAVPSAMAARLRGRILLDGVLDEAAWAAARPITEFTQTDPDEGKPASERSEVRFLFDDDALYIGAHLYDALGARGVTTRLVRRDATFDSDYLQLVIDSYHDHLSRAFFEVNPSGSKSDYIGIGTSCCDPSWDPIWEAATHIDNEGWTAEIRTPYSQLRFSRDSVQTWGLEVRRFIKRRNEEDDWSFWHKNEAGGPSRFGHLEGLRIPAASSHLELM